MSQTDHVSGSNKLRTEKKPNQFNLAIWKSVRDCEPETPSILSRIKIV